MFYDDLIKLSFRHAGEKEIAIMDHLNPLNCGGKNKEDGEKTRA